MVGAGLADRRDRHVAPPPAVRIHRPRRFGHHGADRPRLDDAARSRGRAAVVADRDRACWSPKARSPPASSCGPRICAGRPGRPTASRRPILSRARARSRISSAPSSARPWARASRSPRRRLVRPGDRGFLAAVLTPGDRAVTVTVTVSSGIAGFVFPGDRVDLLLTMAVHAGRRQGPAPRRRDPAHRTCACSRSTSGPTTRTRTWWSPRPRRSRSRRNRPRRSPSPPSSAICRSACAASPPTTARTRSRAYSHTWDSEATHLTDPPDLHAEEPRRRPSRTAKRSRSWWCAAPTPRSRNSPKGLTMMRLIPSSWRWPLALAAAPAPSAGRARRQGDRGRAGRHVAPRHRRQPGPARPSVEAGQQRLHRRSRRSPTSR